MRANRLRAQDLHRFFYFVLIPSSENLVFIYCAPKSGEYARRFKKDLFFNFYRLRKSEPYFSSAHGGAGFEKLFTSLIYARILLALDCYSIHIS